MLLSHLAKFATRIRSDAPKDPSFEISKGPDGRLRVESRPGSAPWQCRPDLDESAVDGFTAAAQTPVRNDEAHKAAVREQHLLTHVTRSHEIVRDLGSADTSVRARARADLSAHILAIRVYALHDRTALGEVLAFDPDQAPGEVIRAEIDDLNTPMESVSTLDSNAMPDEAAVQQAEIAASSAATKRVSHAAKTVEGRVEELIGRLGSADPQAPWVKALAQRMEKYARERLAEGLKRAAAEMRGLNTKEADRAEDYASRIVAATEPAAVLELYRTGQFWTQTGLILTQLEAIRIGHDEVGKQFGQDAKTAHWAARIVTFGIWRPDRLELSDHTKHLAAQAQREILKARSLFEAGITRENSAAFVRHIELAQKRLERAAGSLQGDEGMVKNDDAEFLRMSVGLGIVGTAVVASVLTGGAAGALAPKLFAAGAGKLLIGSASFTAVNLAGNHYLFGQEVTPGSALEDFAWNTAMFGMFGKLGKYLKARAGINVSKGGAATSRELIARIPGRYGMQGMELTTGNVLKLTGKALKAELSVLTKEAAAFQLFEAAKLTFRKTTGVTAHPVNDYIAELRELLTPQSLAHGLMNLAAIKTIGYGSSRVTQAMLATKPMIALQVRRINADIVATQRLLIANHRAKVKGRASLSDGAEAQLWARQVHGLSLLHALGKTPAGDAVKLAHQNAVEALSRASEAGTADVARSFKANDPAAFSRALTERLTPAELSRVREAAPIIETELARTRRPSPAVRTKIFMLNRILKKAGYTLGSSGKVSSTQGRALAKHIDAFAKLTPSQQGAIIGGGLLSLGLMIVRPIESAFILPLLGAVFNGGARQEATAVSSPRGARERRAQQIALEKSASSDSPLAAAGKRAESGVHRAISDVVPKDAAAANIEMGAQKQIDTNATAVAARPAVRQSPPLTAREFFVKIAAIFAGRPRGERVAVSQPSFDREGKPVRMTLRERLAVHFDTSDSPIVKIVVPRSNENPARAGEIRSLIMQGRWHQIDQGRRNADGKPAEVAVSHPTITWIVVRNEAARREVMRRATGSEDAPVPLDYKIITEQQFRAKGRVTDAIFDGMYDKKGNRIADPLTPDQSRIAQEHALHVERYVAGVTSVRPLFDPIRAHMPQDVAVVGRHPVIRRLARTMDAFELVNFPLHMRQFLAGERREISITRAIERRWPREVANLKHEMRFAELPAEWTPTTPPPMPRPQGQGWVGLSAGAQGVFSRAARAVVDAVKRNPELSSLAIAALGAGLVFDAAGLGGMATLMIGSFFSGRGRPSPDATGEGSQRILRLSDNKAYTIGETRIELKNGSWMVTTEAAEGVSVFDGTTWVGVPKGVRHGRVVRNGETLDIGGRYIRVFLPPVDILPISGMRADPAVTGYEGAVRYNGQVAKFVVRAVDASKVTIDCYGEFAGGVRAEVMRALHHHMGNRILDVRFVEPTATEHRDANKAINLNGMMEIGSISFEGINADVHAKPRIITKSDGSIDVRVDVLVKGAFMNEGLVRNTVMRAFGNQGTITSIQFIGESYQPTRFDKTMQHINIGNNAEVYWTSERSGGWVVNNRGQHDILYRTINGDIQTVRAGSWKVLNDVWLQTPRSGYRWEFMQDNAAAAKRSADGEVVRAGVRDPVNAAAGEISTRAWGPIGADQGSLPQSTADIVGFNMNALASRQANQVIMSESVGGNAGPGCLALNAWVDAQGRIVYFGNIQHVPEHITARYHNIAIIIRVMEGRRILDGGRIENIVFPEELPNIGRSRLQMLVNRS